MEHIDKVNNPYGDDKVIDACSLFGVMDRSGKRFSGKDIITAIANMRDRGNGLGAGFAVYGLYPNFPDYYAIHIMYLNSEARERTESFLKNNFNIVCCEEVPTNPMPKITNPPAVWRYFAEAQSKKPEKQTEKDYVMSKIMTINTKISDAFVFSSGKNMAVFKGVGFPEDIAEYFRLEEYQGYLWTAHGRFPTNTPGWWGGAHPFSILDWTVVHNGEISSYGINRRYLEMYGYHCTMQTDTEVMAYAFDLLARRHRLPVEVVSKILAPPLWSQLDCLTDGEKTLYRTLRQVYGSLLINGPFSVIVARQGEMVGLADRIKLRPLTAGVKGNLLYISSEESAIRLICPELDKVWNPLGGEPVISRLEGLRREMEAECIAS